MVKEQADCVSGSVFGGCFIVVLLMQGAQINHEEG